MCSPTFVETPRLQTTVEAPQYDSQGFVHGAVCAVLSSLLLLCAFYFSSYVQ